MGAGLFHAIGRTDRQTDMTKSIVAFRNFAKAHKKVFFDTSINIIYQEFPKCITIPFSGFSVLATRNYAGKTNNRDPRTERRHPAASSAT